MSDVITMAQKAATSDPSGLTLVATDAKGTLHRLKPEGVANMLAETGLVLVRHKLAKQDLDANDFTSPGIWIPSSDLNKWTDVAFENFPVATAKEVNGGFTLIVMKEGGYLKQYFTKYEDNTIYLRSSGYRPAAANSWTKWHKLTSTAVEGGVNAFISTHYAALQKGGSRDGGSKSADTRDCAGSAPERNNVSPCLVSGILGRRPERRSVRLFVRSNDGHTEQSVRLRNTGSDGRLQLRDSTIDTASGEKRHCNGVKSLVSQRGKMAALGILHGDCPVFVDFGKEVAA